MGSDFPLPMLSVFGQPLLPLPLYPTLPFDRQDISSQGTGLSFLFIPDMSSPFRLSLSGLY